MHDAVGDNQRVQAQLRANDIRIDSFYGFRSFGHGGSGTNNGFLRYLAT